MASSERQTFDDGFFPATARRHIRHGGFEQTCAPGTGKAKRTRKNIYGQSLVAQIAIQLFAICLDALLKGPVCIKLAAHRDDASHHANGVTGGQITAVKGNT